MRRSREQSDEELLKQVDRVIKELEIQQQLDYEKNVGKIKSFLQKLSSILDSLRERIEMKKALKYQLLRERQLTCQLLEVQIRSAYEEMLYYRERRLLYQALKKRRNQGKYSV